MQALQQARVHKASARVQALQGASRTDEEASVHKASARKVGVRVQTCKAVPYKASVQVQGVPLSFSSSVRDKGFLREPVVA